MAKQNELIDIVVTSSELGAFEYGNKMYKFWELLNNVKKNPREWQFRYNPLFIPEVKEDYQIAIESKPIGKNGTWRTAFTIYLDTPDARRTAYMTVCRYKDKEASLIQPTSVFVLPIHEVKIDIPDLKYLYPSARILDNLFNFDSSADEFTIVIESPNEETALTLEKDILQMTIEYSFNFYVRDIQQNWVKFSIKTLKESKLFIELSGQAVKYIHRDDLRKLLEKVTNQVDFNAIIEKPEDFEEKLLDKLLARWNAVESSSSFDEIKWQSTYNKDDLKPDVITKELNEMFSKVENEENWKYNTSFSSETKVGLFDWLSAEGNIQGVYTNEGLKKLLNEHNVKVEFEGTKIVVKSIELNQINISDFNEETDILSVKTYMGPNENMELKGFIELNRIVPLQTLYPDLSFQVSRIRNQISEILNDIVPVGSILPFFGTLEQAEQLKSKGWWICDGRIIDDPQSIRNNSPAPDLKNKFLMGDSTHNKLGGAMSHSVSGVVVTSYTNGWHETVRSHTDPSLVVHGPNGWVTGAPIRSSGIIPSFDIPIVPPYCTVIYILKTR
ncbi:hypothetical protein MKJ04_07030 [Pontibacter sp. E15-1]|uniref:hypothetical protein n=1 Tax=Pontibacter sp. E15-1 TaxID=2919918 RepID=UPI001F50250E|nr:hypothetical protein [Pontibacter sp. E15-1]MCJ8164596.1 hypothetical protein [Pontibacter sp. E15-1]